jgi:ribosome-associated translation inhibitor RaiA
MRIDVYRGFDAPESFRDYVGLRLMSVLDHLVRQVNHVAVNLTHVHAPDGGVDTRCRMLALLAPSREARVDETDSGPYTAIDRAAEKLRSAVALQLARRAMDARSLRNQRAGAVVAALEPATSRHAPRTTGSR